MTTTAPIATARRDYENDGVLICPNPGLPADVVRRAAAGLVDVRDGRYDTGLAPNPSPWKPGDPPDRLVKIEQPQIASAALRAVISHEAIGRLALAITGAEWVQIWWVQGLIKPSAAPGAKLPTNVGWHQDRQYWKSWSKESELFTGWLALSEVPIESGPVLFARGSHKWGLLDQGDFYAQDNAALRGQIQSPDGKPWEEVAAVLPIGGISFHHQLTFHGSGPNTAGFPRMSLALHMRTDRSGPAPEDPHPWVLKHAGDESVCPIWRR